MAGKLSGISLGLELILKDLDSAALTTQQCKDIAKVLNSDRNIKPHVISELLDICIKDPEDNIKYAEETLNIVSTVLRKITAKEITHQPDLMPSMLKIINMLITEVYSSNSDGVKILFYKTLLSYPDEAFLKIEEDCFGKVMELLNLYMHQGIPVEIRVQPINLLHKYLKVLPPDKRSKFVEKGLDIWFLKLIPNVMILTSKLSIEVETSVQALEIVTDEFLNVNYEDNPNWKLVLQNICIPEKYPAAMKRLLESGSPIWHRLWIIFMKLLKGQITKIVGDFGSPINSILPVVETAFKMEPRARCQAFQCWDALIDNFATETNEVYIKKRIKLLVIPLRSNNAKVEETIIAKFKTYWRLLCCFHHKVNQFTELLLIPFIHFYFGKPVISKKPMIVPALLSDKTKDYCIEAFVNILGHYDCKGCVKLPRINGEVITARCLIDNWNDLIYCLNVAMKITANSPTKLRGPFKCAWISFVMTICRIPEDMKDDNVKRDFFIGLLAVLEDSIQDCNNENVIDIALSDLILPLFEKLDKLQTLLLPKHDDSSIMTKILKILMNPSFEKLFKRYDMAATVTKLEPFTDFIVEYCLDSLRVVGILLEESPKKYNFMVLWTCLTASLCEKKYSDYQVLSNMLLWPLKHCDMLTNIQHSSLLWYNLYDLIHERDGTASLHEKIINLLKDHENINTMFLLKVSLKLLNQKVTSEKGMQCEKELQLVQHVISKVHTLDDRVPIFNLLMDSIQLISKNLLNTVNEKMAKDVIFVIISALKLIEPELKKYAVDSELLGQVEAMLTTTEKIIKHEVYVSLKQTFATELIHCLSNFSQQTSLKPCALAIMQILTNGLAKNHSLCAEVDNTVESLKQDDNVKNIKEQGKFTTPSKSMAKQVKKKEASIVNTVVENGEEFVVVKSNWKFNPKKLTDKQKEKFQRHREDIPALYQDLSQSQEEFKLKSWKTDSQDTTTSSKSNSSKLVNGVTNQEISTIFKNMPNTDVVPKILKNIIENKDKNNSLSDTKDENIKRNQPPVNKEVKTPKLALKDRVFRNVRNLIEKSNVQNNDEVAKATNDILKTPTGKTNKIPETIINSAPSDINLERPSRVKRKPKKFEDLELFPLKKRRLSLGSTDSQNTEISGYSSEGQEPSSNKKNSQQVINNLDSEFDNQENKTKQESYNMNENECNNENDNKNENLNENCNMNEYKNENDAHKSKDEIRTENENENKNGNLSETPATQMSEEVVVSDAYSLNNTQKASSQIQKENILNKDEKTSATCDLNLNENENVALIQQSPSISLSVECSNQSNDQSNIKVDTQKVSEKKPRKRKSPIERILTIEMVEGHPYLNSQSEKRITRSESPSLRRKTLSDNLNKSKTEKQKNPSKTDKRKRKAKSTDNENIDMVCNSEVSSSQVSSEEGGSQDVIESSQDSTVSVMSIMSTKNVKRIPVVKLKNIEIKNTKHQEETRLSLDDKKDNSSVSIGESKDDSEFPLNKTAAEFVQIDLTENMDTEPIANIGSDSVILINDKESQIVNITDDNVHEAETQDLTHIDLRPVPLEARVREEVKESEVTVGTPDEVTQTFDPETLQKHAIRETIEEHTVRSLEEHPVKCNDESVKITQDESTKSLPDSVLDVPENFNESSSTLSSKDEEQRKLDFLNNTLEISPIKTLSPVRDNKSPSPDSSSDYVVIKLTSPVHSNGQPYENCGSPEVFTEEKVSPDKRDESPLREETHVTTASPRSLSLKKNKPQVRTGGRAAQMLDLCVPSSDRLQTNVNSDKTIETEQQKKTSVISQSARRNLRMLYNSTNESIEKLEENGEGGNFLKFTRELPSADCSPSVPILKRKLSEITDEATVSPASKRKRVSFHDPPVSTTVCVKKYIEPCGVRSPQNSLVKRQERLLRSQLSVNSKSKKRLDTAFKLEKALTKAIESFNDSNVTPSTNEDTEMSSLEPTPLVEVVKNCELNDVDPICKELVDCKDPIDKIARDLSSSAMRQLLVKEFVGKIETIGDLAKMTELEVNRLCIKAPKVKVAKKVLSKYFKRITYTKNKLADVNKSSDSELETSLDKEQTDCDSKEKETVLPLLASNENDEIPSVHTTNEGDDISRKLIDIPISLDLLEKSNETAIVTTQLREQSDVPLEQCTASELPPTIDAVVNKLNVHKTEFVDIEMQTDFVSSESIEVQTESPDTVLVSTQTDKIATISSIVQTDETGSKTTTDIVKMLLDKPDYCEQLTVQLDLSSRQSIADSLPVNTLMDSVVQKISQKESITLIDKLLDKHTSKCIDGRKDEMRLSFMRDYVSDRFSSKDLILFCSEVLKNAYNKNN